MLAPGIDRTARDISEAPRINQHTHQSAREACKGWFESSGLNWESLDMILRSPDADVCPMCESIARFSARAMRRTPADRRPPAHAVWTEPFS
ncbi:hypothetical protein [Caballeronia sp. LZ034LL]|uniref:hypothetical protein n=1 Tax=Caballeronia sp. LZ034LL TaxID=3038567 RepID=UPI00286798C7|nr:hypothetical protein [Caballeronia sp. LZ034LL]MDR5838270.1 hypothetical protein [Caballeronia sp. LZ034LL]